MGKQRPSKQISEEKQFARSISRGNLKGRKQGRGQDRNLFNRQQQGMAAVRAGQSLLKKLFWGGIKRRIFF